MKKNRLPYIGFFAVVISLVSSSPLFADGGTHYYLCGSDTGSNCALDGNGSTAGWATAIGGAQAAKGATDPDGIYHVNGQNFRVERALGAYTFKGAQLVFDGTNPALMSKMSTGANAVFTIPSLLVKSGSFGEFRNGANSDKYLAGGNWVIEEGAELGFSAAESGGPRNWFCSATITGGGTLAAVHGANDSRGTAVNGVPSTPSVMTLTGDLTGFQGCLLAADKGNTCTGNPDFTKLTLAIGTASAFPQATPDGELFERSIVVTNGATISFSCDVTSPVKRGWDFGDGAQPTVEVASGKTVAIYGPVKGSAGFKKTGAGTLVLNVGGEGRYDTITLTGATTVDAATLTAYVGKCDLFVQAFGADGYIETLSDYSNGVLPETGVRTDCEDDVSYTYTAPASVTLSSASRAVCTGWELRDGDNELVRSSSDSGESALSCTIAFAGGGVYRLKWLWTVESASALGTVSASVSRNVFTLSGSLASLGVGTTHVLVSWNDGAWEDVATFPASAADTSFTTAFRGPYGADSTWRVMASNVCDNAFGDLWTEPAAGTCTPVDNTAYTWTGRGGDALWTNPANWSDNLEGDCLGYPASATATATFPDLGAPYVVEVPENLSVKKMTFASQEVTLKGVGASRPRISPSEATAFTRLTLDHCELYRFADRTFAPGTVFRLTNGSSATINNFNMKAAGAKASLILEGGSTFSSTQAYFGGGHEIVIDDSEYLAGNFFCLGDTAPGGRIVFKGANPKLTQRANALFGPNLNDSNVTLEFHIPAGGYASAPVTTTGTGYFFGAPNGSKTGTVTIDVASADGDGTGDYTCPLIVWQKGFNTDGHLLLGALPASASSSIFAFADETAGQSWTDGAAVPATAKSLGVHLVAPETETPEWTDYTAPDGSWSAIADGNGNVVFTFADNEHSILRHWTDADGRLVSSSATITLPVDEAAGVAPAVRYVWHVAETGDDANDGATEATAKATLGAGYALLSSPGDQLHVHPGTYLNEATMYATNGWQIVGVGGAENTTITVAEKFTSFRFVKDNGGDMGVVRGFTIAPANGVRQAHQVANQTGWGLFADCVVTNLGTTSDDVAIRQSTADCVISNCTFYGCQSSGPTGSVIQHWSAGTVLDCKFFDCAGNQDRYGGAVSLGGGASVVRNCLFVNCVNTGTAGAISFDKNGLVENCTIIGCRSTSATTGGGGIGVFGTPGTVRNCIVYGCSNKVGEMNISGNVTVEYTATSPLFDGTGNILLAAMPKFADAENGDYRVVAGATIDAGLNRSWMADAPDLAGRPRLRNGAVDMGAYEYDPDGAPLSVSIAASAAAALLGSEITLSANVMPADATGVTYEWTVTDHNSGATVLTRSGADWATFAYAYPLGQYDVALTVADSQSRTDSDALSCLFSVKPETIWVNNAANEAYPYDTKATAFTNFVDAAAFAEDGMTIILADGVQTNTAADVTFVKAVAVAGEGGPASAAYYTTKNLILNNAGAAIRNLTLTSNYKTDTYFGITQGTLDSCVVTNVKRGARVIGVGANAMVTNCLITGCWNAGRDCFIGADNGIVVNTKIIGNKTTDGSYNEVVRIGSGLLRNCLIAGNESKVGSGRGAVYMTDAATVENCTIVGNAETTGEPIVRIGNAGAVFRNNIVVGNVNKDGPSGVGGAQAGRATYTLSDVAGLSGEGCKTEADLAAIFKNAGSGDYRLSNNSPARDAGVNRDWMADATDLNGNARIIHKRVDMGAYEALAVLGFNILIR